ncbi:TPA: hypothetical protein NHV36_004538 [Klebsiella michiganensis]|uniref:hypothetical protein n=1 Tax=Klebsiella michiganensis TaxID=1134687 RepID=UPI000D526530|nr:hypothetical protein [Klebsiella michiganensis]QLX18608.1 hypothetical protein HV230_29120 [Klebsiella oxytoca]MDU7883645.1 hypothetical protein [Klebsiella michiganensis]HCE8859315.1 hypothetical protein [Klebsiella michiganensis]HCE9045559.1 hypothetical protein [Klebsiella michiganensis]HCE9079681.1 hypothetical protein [Klebsiella michiganensis]
MMKNETLNALILRHGDRMLRQAGWPDAIDMAPVAPETIPGWLAACGTLNGQEILALTDFLCQPLTYGRAELLKASARQLAGTPARLHLYPVQGFPHPEQLTECQKIHLPYAQEWLTVTECTDLLAFLKTSLDQIAEIVRRDSRRLAVALKPSAIPRLMERRIGDWRLLADEYDHDNWLDEDETGRLDQVLDAILVRDARFCPVLLTLVNEREENIEGAGVITDMLRFPGDPVRRWLDRRVLRDVVREARAVRTQA